MVSFIEYYIDGINGTFDVIKNCSTLALWLRPVYNRLDSKGLTVLCRCKRRKGDLKYIFAISYAYTMPRSRHCVVVEFDYCVGDIKRQQVNE